MFVNFCISVQVLKMAEVAGVEVGLGEDEVKEVWCPPVEHSLEYIHTFIEQVHLPLPPFLAFFHISLCSLCIAHFR